MSEAVYHVVNQNKSRFSGEILDYNILVLTLQALKR
ncbi:hypothetical protein MFFDBJGM_01510 [Pectobacterium versatile]|nr:hypothetical protein MFFDBJGM_01510 [Pectobacterium versatile]